ncbi:hypothetical protein PCE1_004231 [Barthelona sp. PCE]
MSKKSSGSDRFLPEVLQCCEANIRLDQSIEALQNKKVILSSNLEVNIGAHYGQLVKSIELLGHVHEFSIQFLDSMEQFRDEAFTTSEHCVRETQQEYNYETAGMLHQFFEQIQQDPSYTSFSALHTYLRANQNEIESNNDIYWLNRYFRNSVLSATLKTLNIQFLDFFIENSDLQNDLNAYFIDNMQQIINTHTFFSFLTFLKSTSLIQLNISVLVLSYIGCYSMDNANYSTDMLLEVLQVLVDIMPHESLFRMIEISIMYEMKLLEGIEIIEGVQFCLTSQKFSFIRLDTITYHLFDILCAALKDVRGFKFPAKELKQKIIQKLLDNFNHNDSMFSSDLIRRSICLVYFVSDILDFIALGQYPQSQYMKKRYSLFHNNDNPSLNIMMDFLLRKALRIAVEQSKFSTIGKRSHSHTNLDSSQILSFNILNVLHKITASLSDMNILIDARVLFFLEQELQELLASFVDKESMDYTFLRLCVDGLDGIEDENAMLKDVGALSLFFNQPFKESPGFDKQTCFLARSMTM